MVLTEGAVNSLPQIVENYHDFEPPRQVRPIVEELLRAAPSQYLIGLKTILLTNQSALTRDQRRQKVSGRKGKSNLANARGAYYEATNSNHAYVLVLVDNCLKSWPTWAVRVPFLGSSVLSEVVYHEIGHHIHAVHRPIHDGEESPKTGGEN